MHKYRLVAKKGEGTFSEVLKAQCIKNGKYVAIKCMKNHFDSLDQVNNLREIQALRRLSPHANIIKLTEVLYDQPTGRLALVFELMDMNIYELIRGRRHYVAEDRTKNYMYQLMKAMDHMHRNGIFHRDLKPENILIIDDVLKLADFGSCRGIYSKQPYTEYISTRWYRAPECLLTDGYYNYKMDMWGVGCVFFEVVSLFPLFPGTNELDQIQKIHNILGTPPAELLTKMKKRSQHMDFNFPSKEGTGIPKLIPHVSPDCVDLIVKLLMYNPDDRLSARQALRHPYFRDLREVERRQKALMTPEVAPGLSAQPSASLVGGASQPSSLGMGAHSGHHLDDETTKHMGKPARQAASPAVSDDGGNGTTSPPGSSRADPPQSLPSITTKGSQGGHAPAHTHSLPGIGQQQQAAAHQGGPHHSHSLQSMGHHSLQEGVSGHHYRSPMEAAQEADETGSMYRMPNLHAESSMDTGSLFQGEGGLPPIGNLSLGKSSLAGASRRAVPNYGYSNHDAAAPSYPKNKNSIGSLTKRQGMGAVSHSKGYTTKPGVPPGLIGQVGVAGHKVTSSTALTELPSGGVPGQGNYNKYPKANASKVGGGGSKYGRSRA